jgi:prepilin-type N-terminal cleavage/methylation domain-containing protein
VTHAAIGPLRRACRRLAGQAGMSLVELMVALTVVGILIGIAAPTIHTHVSLQELRGGAREVVDVLRNARDAAMNEGVPRYILFTPPRTYRVYRYSGGQWVALTNPVLLADSVSFTDAGVTFPQLSSVPTSGATVPENAAYFDTRGRYPFEVGAPASHSITLVGGTGRQIVLELFRQTGKVTGV